MDNETGKKLAEWIGVGNGIYVKDDRSPDHSGTLESFGATSLKVKSKMDGAVYTIGYKNIADINQFREGEIAFGSRGIQAIAIGAGGLKETAIGSAGPIETAVGSGDLKKL